MANLKKAVTTKWIALGALCILSVVLLFAIVQQAPRRQSRNRMRDAGCGMRASEQSDVVNS